MNVSPTARAGFTLIEIMIAIAILGLLMAVVAPRFMGLGEGAKLKLVSIELKRLQDGIKTFKVQSGRYPERLRDLVERPQDEKLAKKWRRVWDDDLPEDPWGNDYRYRLTSGSGGHPYELYSEGDIDADDAEPISVWD
jgi:general secretion pathway protein G